MSASRIGNVKYAKRRPHSKLYFTEDQPAKSGQQKASRIEEMDIFEQVEGQVPLQVSNAVFVPKKNGDNRLCIDMRFLPLCVSVI